MDWDEVVSSSSENAVEVPPMQTPLNREQYTRLCQLYDMNDITTSSQCDGIDIYVAVRQYVQSVIE